MAKKSTFDTIWRQKLAPVIVDIPKEQYREWIPCVDVIPLGVEDNHVFAVDDKFRIAYGKAYQDIQLAVKALPPVGIGVPLRQLIQQLPDLISGVQDALRVFFGRRIAKVVPVAILPMNACIKLRNIMLERLLLFEDLFPIGASLSTVEGYLESERGALRHEFVRGKKADTLLDVLRLSKNKKTVIFVRNIPVCEELSKLLVEKGFKAVYAHGDVNDARYERLYSFKKGPATVLVVTRQLFGRGFDLPEADQAIFYSPKDSEKTMWQELLRIRSTVRSVKKCFILFYVWTAEADKMTRLLQRMMRTNASFRDNSVRWTYFEAQEPDAKTEAPVQKEAEPATEQESDQRDSVTKAFVKRLLEIIRQSHNLHPDDVIQHLNMAARESGFVGVWPRHLVDIVIRELAVTVAMKAKGKMGKLKRFLACVFHPDRYPGAIGLEKQFWHELFVAIEI